MYRVSLFLVPTTNPSKDSEEGCCGRYIWFRAISIKSVDSKIPSKWKCINTLFISRARNTSSRALTLSIPTRKSLVSPREVVTKICWRSWCAIHTGHDVYSRRAVGNDWVAYLGRNFIPRARVDDLVEKLVKVYYSRARCILYSHACSNEDYRFRD